MPGSRAEPYRHEDEALLRPDVGTQAQFRKRKPPKSYRYDSSLSPALDWDGGNAARELGEWLLAQIEEAAALEAPHRFAEPRRLGDVEVTGLHDAVERLKALSRPFLDWAGKAEGLSFDVPTLPLFVHERLSTKAILETLTGHARDRQLEMQLFADPQLPLHQQLEAYEHKGGWANRLILGDSLVVMNSLLEYEGLGGQVQTIYIDPPYGVKFGSNFQPFVRKRDVKDGNDGDMTREPEMVKAYRDTWELGLHSYLSYLRDRLLVARELLTPSGSLFVQISDENLHHVRELMDEVFGPGNFCSVIPFVKTSGFSPTLLSNVADFLIWYAKDASGVKYHQAFLAKSVGDEGATQYDWLESLDGKELRTMTGAERLSMPDLVSTHRIFAHGDLSAQGTSGNTEPFTWNGDVFRVPSNCHWKTTPQGLQRLAGMGRLMAVGKSLRYKRYLSDFPVYPVSNVWTDTGTSGFADKKLYVVQTNPSVVERCLLMTTDPGDLVLDPTCGSGTTAYVAEQWGRRWITIDTSRVPLALARQRLLTATFPYYELQDKARGPGGGFVYKRKQNQKGEDIGGIVPHITLKSIANEEPPAEEVLVDRPEIEKKITRVSGPFTFEATIPTPASWGEDGDESAASTDASYVDRMLDVLRRSPIVQLGGGRTLALTGVRPPARSLSLSAEAGVEGDERQVAILFGPENGAVSELVIYDAAREANVKGYQHLLVIGFAIQPSARELVEKAEGALGIAATYVQATPDLAMGDLLKTMRSSQIFSVTALPEIEIRELPPEEKGGPKRYEVELLGLDSFDPATMKAQHLDGNDVPAWLLDTGYNELSFHVSQAFFPRTGAWDSLKRALKGELEDSVWEHLAGTVSAPFEAGETEQVAVKVIDDRGNELLVVKPLSGARPL